jgi:hypothetical protein
MDSTGGGMRGLWPGSGWGRVYGKKLLEKGRNIRWKIGRQGNGRGWHGIRRRGRGKGRGIRLNGMTGKQDTASGEIYGSFDFFQKISNQNGL